LIPIAAEIDKKGEFPTEIVKELGKLGLMGVYVPGKYGGSDMDVVSYAIAMEEISRGCASTGVIMSVNNSLACDPILKFGNEEQKMKYLTQLASGEKLGCFALTEPNAGTDAIAQKTVAVKEGEYYIINGSKNFITNAPQADYAIVFAVTDKAPVKKSQGISAFIVDMKTKGVSIGKIEDKLGIKGASSASIIFDDVKVHESDLLVKEGMGFKIAMATLDGGRIGIAAQALGISRAALEEAANYSKERKQFGQSIASFQAIQFMLADMATKIEASRLLIRESAYLKDQKDPNFGTISAMAKLYAAETSGFVTSKAIQIFGGYGYTKDYPAERHFRDARITEIYEGTSEVQRMVISRSVLKD
jgi:butyryl-CoA dehydrogenase